MGLDFTGNMNYQQMQHIDAGAALQNTLRGMVDDRTKSAEMAAKLAQQKKDNVRADANLLLNQNEATRKAQQDEYNMQLKAAEMGLTSDKLAYDKQSDEQKNAMDAAKLQMDFENRQAILEGQNKVYGETIRKNQYEENKDAGAGYLFKTQGTTEEVDDTKVFDKEGAGVFLKKFTTGVGEAEKTVTTGTYEDYLKDTSPAAYEEYNTKDKDKPGILGQVTDFFSQGEGTYSKTALSEHHKRQNTSQADRDNAPRILPNKVMSKSEWKSAQKKAYQGAAKLPSIQDAMKDRLLTDTEYQEEQGLLKAVPGATKATSLPNDQILSGIQSEVIQAVESYKQTHNTDKVPSGWLAGLNLAAKNKYDSIMTSKSSSAVKVQDRVEDRQDMAFKASLEHASKKEILQMKSQLKLLETDDPMEQALNAEKLELMEEQLKKLRREND